jgi:uncharacterized protein (TIGR02611 family)
LVTTVDPTEPEPLPTPEDISLAEEFTEGRHDDELEEPQAGVVEAALVRDARRRRRVTIWARKAGVALGGGLILAAGIAMIPLPGPGWLVVVLGLWVLSLEFSWAERLLEPIKDKVIEAAHAAASNRWGTVLSVLSACGIIVAGIVWATWDRVPYGSWLTGGSLAASGVLALVTIGWSVHDLRKKRARLAAEQS